ncbi:MAG TPA: hypothetical protein VKZ53_32020 [Candidatus Angelobacter sp.]|nr:hypothetical protein [Candidatus Angelobacter sp.]
MKSVLLFLGAIILSATAFAQQTILNVASADVLDKNQIYFRLDTTVFASPETATLAPNFIFGFGHNLEGGVNINAFGVPGDTANRSIVPNLKWKFLSTKADKPIHLDLYAGDQIFIPTFHRTFDVGNYLYAAGAVTIHNDTRFTVGGWHSADVVVAGSRGGALLGLEQTIAHAADKRNLITLAGDWQSGQGSNGALTLGAMIFPTNRLMLIPSFQIANSGDHNANAFVFFLGYMLKK